MKQIKSLIIIVTIIMIGSFIGCRSKVVPPGTTVIVLTASGDVTIKHQGSYIAYGRDRVYFVDTKLKSFTEQLKILCKDKVNMTVYVKWIGSFDVSKHNIQIIKEKVPATKITTESDIQGFQLSLVEFYKIAIQDVVRANSRMVVSPYVTDAISDNREKIEMAIKKRILNRLKKLSYPVKTSDILLSNLDFDPEITKTRQAIKAAELSDQKKAALAKATVAQARRDEDIAREQGKADIVRAQVRARENYIISKSITPEILAMRQWDVLEQAAKGPNNEIFVIPYEALRTSDLTSTVINKSAISNIDRQKR